MRELTFEGHWINMYDINYCSLIHRHKFLSSKFLSIGKFARQERSLGIGREYGMGLGEGVLLEKVNLNQSWVSMSFHAFIRVTEISETRIKIETEPVLHEAFFFDPITKNASNKVCTVVKFME